MIKKIVSLLLVTVTILSLAAPPICAEALNADNIPIVEYIPQNPATPSVLSNEGSSDDRYADAKIISVSREATLTSKQTDLANLMNERNVVFFKNQSAYEVSQATGIPSGLSCDSTETSTVLLGTSVTRIDSLMFSAMTTDSPKNLLLFLFCPQMNLATTVEKTALANAVQSIPLKVVHP